MYLDSSWSDGNWFTCFTIHLLTLTWPLRNEAIKQETLRLSWLSISAPADTSSWTTSRCPPVTEEYSQALNIIQNYRHQYKLMFSISGFVKGHVFFLMGDFKSIYCMQILLKRSYFIWLTNYKTKFPWTWLNLPLHASQRGELPFLFLTSTAACLQMKSHWKIILNVIDYCSISLKYQML